MFKFVRYAQGALAFVRLVRDMSRTDEVFEVVAGLDSDELMRPVAAHLYAQAGGDVVTTKPRIGKIDLEALSKLPEGTLGRVYADHMRRLQLDPSFYPELEIKSDIDFVRLSLYETHDVWHVVTGFATDVAGELGLQAFYAAQLKVGFLPPVLLAAGMLNAALFDVADIGPRFEAVSRGWQLGRAAKALFGMPWAELWATPLSSIRRDLGLGALPQPQSVAEPSPALTYGAALG